MTAARLASIASSQSMTNLSGASATPSRDNSSYNTTLRMHTPPVERDAAYSDGSIRRNSPVCFGRDPMAGDAHSAATTAGADALVERERGRERLMGCLSLGCGESPLRLLVERDVGDGEVLFQVRHRGGAGYQQDVGRQAQGPGERDLGRSSTEPFGDCPDLRIAQHLVVLCEGRAQREERHERYSPCGAFPQDGHRGAVG